MNGLGVLARPIGRMLLRCLVGKYGTILWTSALAMLVGGGAYLSLLDNGGSGGADQSPVYSVAAVNANLAQNPGLWLRRTILVRGEIEPCTIIQRGDRPCPVLASYPGELVGLDQSAAPIGDPLPVVRAGFDPVLLWGEVATYRAQLVSIPADICAGVACVEAKILDSAP